MCGEPSSALTIQIALWCSSDSRATNMMSSPLDDQLPPKPLSSRIIPAGVSCRSSCAVEVGHEVPHWHGVLEPDEHEPRPVG